MLSFVGRPKVPAESQLSCSSEAVRNEFQASSTLLGQISIDFLMGLTCTGVLKEWGKLSLTPIIMWEELCGSSKRHVGESGPSFNSCDKHSITSKVVWIPPPGIDM